MSVCELLSRTNRQSAWRSGDEGRSTSPQPSTLETLTGALGMMKCRELAILLVEHYYAEEMAERSNGRLLELLAEILDKEREALRARAEFAAKRCADEPSARNVALLGMAKVAMWPDATDHKNSARYGMLRRLVLKDLRRSACTHCNGKKHTGSEIKPEPCDRCGATGVKRMTQDELGEGIGIHRNLFRMNWLAPYSYLLKECVSAQQEGEQAFPIALRGE